ncbi:chaplin family protein [Streptomyces sp. NPDC002143]
MKSPGVGSANVVGNTADLIALLNQAFGNAGVNR